MPFTDPFVANPYPYAYANTLATIGEYNVPQALVAGTYTISWSGGGTLQIDFYNGTTFIGSATGTSQIIYNLAQSATNYKLWNTVAPVSLVISLTALAVAPVSGVLTTITATSSPGLIGDAYLVLVGAGGGGSGKSMADNGAGGSGGSGGIYFGRIYLDGTETITIGSAGQGGIASSLNATAGGSTVLTMGATVLTATGGQPGGLTVCGAGGTPNGVGQTFSYGQAGIATQTLAQIAANFFQQGSTGTGATGNVTTPTAGGGSGIGTGGTGGGVSSNGSNATGYGAGGGGCGNDNSTTALNGGNGSPGICYIVI